MTTTGWFVNGYNHIHRTGMTSTSNNPLWNKLKSLGVKTGAADLTPAKVDSNSIDSVVAGSFLSTPRGEVFVAEQTYPASYIYGSAPLLSSSPFARIAHWANDPAIEDFPLT